MNLWSGLTFSVTAPVCNEKEFRKPESNGLETELEIWNDREISKNLPVLPEIDARSE